LLSRARYKAKASEKAEFTPVNEHFEINFNTVDDRVSRKATTCQGSSDPFMNPVLVSLMSSFMVDNLRHSPANPRNLTRESEWKTTSELRPDLNPRLLNG